MKSLFKIAAMSAAVIGLAGAANATETLHINSVKVIHGGSSPYSATLTVDNPRGKDLTVNALLSPQRINNSLKAFCVELSQFSGTGDFTVTSLKDFVNDTAKYSKLTALISNYGVQDNSALVDAAVQLAVWEVLYEGANNVFNITKDVFSSSNWSDSYQTGRGGHKTTNSAVRDEANSILASLSGLEDTGAYDFFVATNKDKQDLLYFTPKAPVPEPATWALMIAGFGLVGASMRRRTVRTAVSFG